MKTHQNILDGELKKMQTRLTRIKGMIANQRRLNGASVGKDFEKELDEIIDTNQRLELENKRLRKQVSGLKAKMATLQQKSKYRKSPVKYMPGHQRGTRTQMNLNEDLLAQTGGDYEHAYYKIKEQNTHNVAIIQKLEDEKMELSRQRGAGEDSMSRMQGKMDDMNRDNQFMAQKEQIDDLLDQLKNLRIENKALQNQKLILETESGAQRSETSRMQEIIGERNMLQSKLDDLLQLPFFKREAGKSTFQENQDLRLQLKEKENEGKSAGDTKQKVEAELGRMKDELRIITAERDNLKQMNLTFKNKIVEGPGMDMKDMMSNLLNADPNEFR